MAVMLCYDGSASAKHAVEIVAKTMRDQEIAIVHVFNPPVPYLSDSFSDPSTAAGPSVAELERTGREYAQERLAEGEAAARAAGLTVTTRLAPGEPTVARAILDVADDLGADLIVIGTHGHTAIVSELLGSVSSEVLHESSRPVLIVPSPATR